MGGTSRMNREVHVRICEGLGVQFPGPTRREPNWIGRRTSPQRLELRDLLPFLFARLCLQKASPHVELWYPAYLVHQLEFFVSALPLVPHHPILAFVVQVS